MDTPNDCLIELRFISAKLGRYANFPDKVRSLSTEIMKVVVALDKHVNPEATWERADA